MTLAIQLTSIIISILALVAAIASLALTIGMKLSTHKIEWKPLDISGDLQPTEEEQDQIEEDSILSKALDLQKKKKRQEDPLDVIAETSNF